MMFKVQKGCLLYCLQLFTMRAGEKYRSRKRSKTPSDEDEEEKAEHV